MSIEIITTRPKGRKKTALKNLNKILNTKYGKGNFQVNGEKDVVKTSKKRYRAKAEVEIKTE